MGVFDKYQNLILMLWVLCLCLLWFISQIVEEQIQETTSKSERVIIQEK